MKIHLRCIITLTLLAILLFSFGQAQTDTVENYFPTKVGTTWVYRIYPDFSNERERLTITSDSVSSADSSRFLFINGGVKPKYRIDTSLNVYLDPFGSPPNGNLLILKQKANTLEAWAMFDSLINGGKRIARIKNAGFTFVFDRVVKFKEVEWGSASPIYLDTFALSARSEYYATGFGLYFVIVEPPSTERALVGFISNNDTLGDITKVINLKNSQLSSFILHQNYPNPFNSSTTILYELKYEQIVTIKIFDVLGREVQELIHQQQSAGQHKIYFDASELKTGMYFLRLKAGDAVQTKKLLYLQ